MAFILVPRNGEDIIINAWNWRPTLELLRSAKLISNDLFEGMGIHGVEARVDANTANRIADYLDEHIRAMKQGDRMRYDLTITDLPKKPIVITPTTREEGIDVIEAYSASYEWLVQFRDFCRSSGGFKVS